MPSISKQSVIILTGASRGIGLSTLKFLLNAGINVVTTSRTRSIELDALIALYPVEQCLVLTGDVSSDTDNQNAVNKAISTYGRLDGLILNAAILSPLGTTASMSTATRLAEYKTLFDINFFSLISIISHALPHLNIVKDSTQSITGRIIMVSSGAATGGVAGWGAYSASKAAMNSLARTLGNEEPTIVTVALRPGVVDTAMQVAIRETGGEFMTAADHSKFTGLHTSGSLVQPEGPAKIMAELSISAKIRLSGTFVTWDQPDLLV